MSKTAPWDRLNIAGPRDTLQDDLNAAYRKNFAALKSDIEAICSRAGIDVQTEPEAFEFFKDTCDEAFEIDWGMASMTIDDLAVRRGLNHVELKVGDFH